jgi:hypothetical protein
MVPLRDHESVWQSRGNHGYGTICREELSLVDLGSPTDKAKGLTHHEDAALAVETFQSRYPALQSDVPAEPAINHAAVALQVAGFAVPSEEIKEAAIVLCVPQKGRAPS